MAALGKLYVLTAIAVILGVITPIYKSLAQDTSLENLNALLIRNASSGIDSMVITGMLQDQNKMLMNKFKRDKIENFYKSIMKPGDYFVNMKKYLNWNFGDYVRNMQENIINRQDFDTTNHAWLLRNTPNFIIYYMAASSDTEVIKTLGAYLEAEFTEMKILLAIDERENIRSLFIRTFYPDSEKSYEIPKPPERTGGKIQILLFPDLSEFKRHFPYGGVDSQTGGMCLFSLYQRPSESVKEILINVRVAMVFGGYISFPFMMHELAHALHFIYYSDLDSIDKDAARLNEIYEKQGKEAYNNIFWPTFKERIPGNNGIFEEAIANYAMFSTGPFLRSGIVPPLRYLTGRELKSNNKVISRGAEGGIDYGLLNFIGSKLKLCRSPKQKLVEEIFSWADFLRYLNASHSPQQMSSLYSIKEQDLSNSFRQIFGITIQQSELEWLARFRNGQN